MRLGSLGINFLVQFAVAAFGLRFETEATAQGQVMAKANPDWPCQQILVEPISLAAVWSGPSIKDLDWRMNPKIVEMNGKLAARKLPIEDAASQIDAFAKSTESTKAQELPELFAALFATLNAERSQVIAGLIRFGKKQKDLAEKIKAENDRLLEARHQHGEGGGTDATDPKLLEQLQWNVRIFDDRRQALSYVCEVPVLIERRLFALGRAIEANLE
jgi:hypothetical protein